MAQGVLGFQYKVEEKSGGMTGVAGLPLYLDLIQSLGLRGMMREHVRAREGNQGWTDDQMLVAMVLLNLRGGDCVEDIRSLEDDEGFCRLVRRVEFADRKVSERRGLLKRWRKPRRRTFPSVTAIREYLERFHDPEQERGRKAHEAFIPGCSALLRGLVRLNGAFAAAVQRRSLESNATLDMDATLVETYKRAAMYCYKKFKAYQPLNVYWAEQGLMLFSEFRDGNVPAGYDLLRPFQEALGLLPEGVKRVYLRSDTAGYIVELLRYCAEGRNERFGVIEFAVGVDVTDAFRDAVREVEADEWRPLYREENGRRQATGQEYAEVCFVPNWAGRTKGGPTYRFLAIREPLEEGSRRRGEEEQLSLPFPTMNWGRSRYKLTGIVTNRTIPGDEVIRWYRERCGKSEEAHAVMKSDLAGGKLPSQLFGANAAWWHIMILAFNLHQAMKRFALGKGWENSRMKAIRLRVINLPGRVVERGRRLFIRLVGGHESNELLIRARRRILCLCDSG